MASIKHTGGEDRKASALTDSTHAHTPVAPTEGKRESNPREPGAAGLRRRGARLWVAILVDILLILAIVGLFVGGFFGYRAVRELYAPTWETREVVFCVMMEGIDPEMVKYNQDGRPTFTGNAIWSSGSTDADRLGTVTDVRTVLVTHTDRTNSLTLYLTVEAEARYREGQGYYMGNTHLLAGIEGIFRVQGMSAEGMVISLGEPTAETEAPAEAVTEPHESVVADPEAQG